MFLHMGLRYGEGLDHLQIHRIPCPQPQLRLALHNLLPQPLLEVLLVAAAKCDSRQSHIRPCCVVLDASADGLRPERNQEAEHQGNGSPETKPSTHRKMSNSQKIAWAMKKSPGSPVPSDTHPGRHAEFQCAGCLEVGACSSVACPRPGPLGWSVERPGGRGGEGRRAKGVYTNEGLGGQRGEGLERSGEGLARLRGDVDSVGPSLGDVALQLMVHSCCFLQLELKGKGGDAGKGGGNSRMKMMGERKRKASGGGADKEAEDAHYRVGIPSLSPCIRCAAAACSRLGSTAPTNTSTSTGLLF